MRGPRSYCRLPRAGGPDRPDDRRRGLIGLVRFFLVRLDIRPWMLLNSRSLSVYRLSVTTNGGAVGVRRVTYAGHGLRPLLVVHRGLPARCRLAALRQHRIIWHRNFHRISASWRRCRFLLGLWVCEHAGHFVARARQQLSTVFRLAPWPTHPWEVLCHGLFSACMDSAGSGWLVFIGPVMEHHPPTSCPGARPSPTW